ncbi:hypothetical protein Y695_04044 [Hydrogenophaga sp. T4]|nr:hypothetical protein Y695_04044 [Hydrogenophaga sp. T4]
MLPSARCAVPKASCTKMSHKAPSFWASSGLFFFSPLFRRQFSSITTSPGATEKSPSTQLATTRMLRPMSWPMRAATGVNESAGLNSPSVGRPRCEVTMTAAPASSAIWMAGMLARMRVSSVMLPASSCGTLRSARMKIRLPLAKPLAHTSLNRRNFMAIPRISCDQRAARSASCCRCSRTRCRTRPRP